MGSHLLLESSLNCGHLYPTLSCGLFGSCCDCYSDMVFTQFPFVFSYFKNIITFFESCIRNNTSKSLGKLNSLEELSNLFVNHVLHTKEKQYTQCTVLYNVNLKEHIHLWRHKHSFPTIQTTTKSPRPHIATMFCFPCQSLESEREEADPTYLDIPNSEL